MSAKAKIERALHVWLTVKPSPKTLHETNAIFAHVDSIARVRSFLYPRYQQQSGNPSSGNVGKLQIHVQLEDFGSVEDPLEKLLGASPFHVSIRPDDNSKEADPFGIRGLALRKKVTPRTFHCEVNAIDGESSETLRQLQYKPKPVEKPAEGKGRLWESLRRAGAPLSILEGLSTPPRPAGQERASNSTKVLKHGEATTSTSLATASVNKSFLGLMHYYQAGLNRAQAQDATKNSEFDERMTPAYKKAQLKLYTLTSRIRHLERTVNQINDEMQHRRVVTRLRKSLVNEGQPLHDKNLTALEDWGLVQYLLKYRRHQGLPRNLQDSQARLESEKPQPLSISDIDALRKVAEGDSEALMLQEPLPSMPLISTPVRQTFNQNERLSISQDDEQQPPMSSSESSTSNATADGDFEELVEQEFKPFQAPSIFTAEQFLDLHSQPSSAKDDAQNPPLPAIPGARRGK